MSIRTMKSSTSGGRRYLEGPAIEALLLRWVNLPDAPDLESRAELLVKHYPEIFDELRPLAGEDAEGVLKSVVGVRNHLQAVWDAPTDRDREWYCFRLRQLYAQHLTASKNQTLIEALKSLREVNLERIQDKAAFYALEQGVGRAAETFWRQVRFWGIHVEAPPQPTHFDRLIHTLQRLGRRTRHCENPNCPRPYFFASRSSQRFCSNACAVPAQREAKRRWWDSNRTEQLRKRREGRRSQQSKKRRKS
ncbi:MAG: hypothetical protein L0338_31245 [Acidobacteria bacterium]|nr:hypothetical protein [Acidobacteriota bacterium]